MMYVAHDLAQYTTHVIDLGALPGSPEHGDVTDWLATGHTIEELTALVDCHGRSN
jgi:hypothetical protein